MNTYGLPISGTVKQTVIPVLFDSGNVIGWYLVSETTFTDFPGEDTLDLGDAEVPIKSVTVDSPKGRVSYIAAVFPSSTPSNTTPWASSSMMSLVDGYYSNWVMASGGQGLKYDPGNLLRALKDGNFNLAVYVPEPSSPVVNSLTATWQASVKYTMLNGPSPCFDFNWVTLMSTETQWLRIEVVSSPAALSAKVVGTPVAMRDGVVYDTIRIQRTGATVAPGAYEFVFNVYDQKGAESTATLTLTVV